MGKSYICRAIEEQIKVELNPVALTTPVFDKRIIRMLPDTLRKIMRAGLFFARNPATTLNLYYEIFKGKSAPQIGSRKKFVNLLSELQRSSGVDKSISLMTDQGVLQGIWSLEMLADESVYRRLMQISVRWLPDAVILVEADMRQNKQQIEHRTQGRSSFDRLQGEELLEAIERGNQSRDKLLSHWTELVPAGHYLNYRNNPGSDTRVIYDWLVARIH